MPVLLDIFGVMQLSAWRFYALFPILCLATRWHVALIKIASRSGTNSCFITKPHRIKCK